MLQALRRNVIAVVTFLLIALTAFLSGRAILNNPGMSVSGWISIIAPAAAVCLAVAFITMNVQAGSDLSALFSFSRPGINKKTLLITAVPASALGLLIVLNPFDFIMPLFITLSGVLFSLSVYMLLNHKSLDAVGLLMISLPFLTYVEYQTVRWNEGFGSDWITIKTAIIILFSIIWLIADKMPRAASKFNALVLLFVLTVFCSALFSSDVVFSMQRWLFEIVYPVIFYFIALNSISREEDTRKFKSYFLAAIFVNVILVLYYFLKYGGWDVLGEYVLNVSFADGVLVANVLIIAMPLVIASLVTEQKRGLRLLYYAMLALGLAGLVMSFARTAQLSMAIGLSAFVFNKKTRKYLMFLLIACILLIAFNSEILTPYLSKYEGLTFEGLVHESSMEKRYEGWKAALDMFKDHPVTGVGIGGYVREYAKYAPEYYAEYARGYVSMISAHNIYLTYLAETGLLGALPFLLMLSTITVKAFQAVRRGGKDSVFKHSLFISVLIFSINNLTDGITFAYVKEIDKGMAFWSIAALIVSRELIEKNKGAQNVRQNI
ncbi:MAG: O-antigen ligase family protein [Nitrospirae bacterium]|nr:O-antigen ligase family protein [Nitrospirota bacterium]